MAPINFQTQKVQDIQPSNFEASLMKLEQWNTKKSAFSRFKRSYK